MESLALPIDSAHAIELRWWNLLCDVVIGNADPLASTDNPMTKEKATNLLLVVARGA